MKKSFIGTAIILGLIVISLVVVASCSIPLEESSSVPEEKSKAEISYAEESKGSVEISYEDFSSEKSEENVSYSEESEEMSEEEKSEAISEEKSAEISVEISEEESEEEPEASEESEEEYSVEHRIERELPDHIAKDDNKKYVAFTFDDGPSKYTPDLLDYIEEKGYKVTFFSVGVQLEAYGKYISRAVNLGCEAGVHCYTHEYQFNKCSDEVYQSEINKTAELVYKYAGYYPIIMRPPYGSITSARVKLSDYNVIIWSVDSQDWMNSKRTDEATIEKNVTTIVDNILNGTDGEPGVRNGSIVLMHDLYQNSIEAFKRVTAILEEQGYVFVTVGELLDLDYSTTIGKRYWSMTYFK